MMYIMYIYIYMYRVVLDRRISTLSQAPEGRGEKIEGKKNAWAMGAGSIMQRAKSQFLFSQVLNKGLAVSLNKRLLLFLLQRECRRVGPY